MMNGHFTGEYIRSEFTSWAANLSSALNFAWGPEEYHIAILDTTSFATHDPARSLDIFHVPQLWRAGLADHTYDHEYLVHGDVRGKGYHYLCMPLDRKAVQYFRPTYWSHISADVATQRAMEFAAPLLNQCASPTAHGMYISMVAMLLGSRYQLTEMQLFQAQIPRILMTMQSVLGALEMKELRKQWGGDETILMDLVYTTGRTDVILKMAIRVLRSMAIQP